MVILCSSTTKQSLIISNVYHKKKARTCRNFYCVWARLVRIWTKPVNPRCLVQCHVLPPQCHQWCLAQYHLPHLTITKFKKNVVLQKASVSILSLTVVVKVSRPCPQTTYTFWGKWRNRASKLGSIVLPAKHLTQGQNWLSVLSSQKMKKIQQKIRNTWHWAE